MGRLAGLTSNPAARANRVFRSERASVRIGFLFNHDQIHQVAHSLPIAMRLAEAETGAEIIVATTNVRLREEVQRLAAEQIGSSIELVELRLRRPLSKALARFASGVVPAAKLLVYRDNLDFFRSLDVLVVAEKTSLVLKSRYGLKKLKIIHTRHGAGDRAIGFDAASAKFDHVLVSGPKVRDRLIEEAGVAPERISVVGYPKFDLFGQASAPRSVGKRPVVLYNPHVSPHLSSWYKLGQKVLDWFAAHPEYELIFAPHVMLFERRMVATVDRLRVDFPGSIDPSILAAPNIHIDLGSRASTTMEYLDRADIYLGDVSSQAYEFLIRPRPCVFLNAHRVAWRDDPNYAIWRAGPVIERVDDLGVALTEAQEQQGNVFAPIQRLLFDAAFDLTDQPSAERAAEAVARFAGLSR